ncbi:MAG: luciferase family oxidoreductase, group 1 [Amycolatopsis sp.]|nr:luciferase family oxidoreductase, group 1 [Amycolatopsis sp.]
MAEQLPIPVSVLEVGPVWHGSSAAESLRHTLESATAVETLGYHRFWVAEHHATPCLATAATAVLVGQVAAATTTLRAGSGGILLPNHAAKPCPAGAGRAVRYPRGVLPGPDRPRPGPGPWHGPGDRRSATPDQRERGFPQSAGRARQLFPPAGRAGRAHRAHRRARRSVQAAVLDPRIQPLQCRTRGFAWSSVRLREPDQSEWDGCGTGPLPRLLHSFRPARPAPDAHLRTGCRSRHGRGRAPTGRSVSTGPDLAADHREARFLPRPGRVRAGRPPQPRRWVLRRPRVLRWP